MRLIGLMAILLACVSIAQSPEYTVAVEVKGLHCQGCVEPVEAGLKQVAGVKSVHLDFRTGIAQVKFTEERATVSELVNHVAQIPHAMGKSMKYSGALLLRIEGKIDKVQKALRAIQGVQKVETRERTVLCLTFKSDAKVRYAQIQKAVADAGAKLLPWNESEKDSHAGHSH